MRFKKIYIFDPTVKDKLSKTRGLGRYTRLLTKALPEAEVVSSPKEAEKDSLLIFPYLDPLKAPQLPPKQTFNIAVIHDVIKLKYEDKFPKGLKSRVFLFLNKFALNGFNFFITDAKATIKDLEKYLGIKRKKITAIHPPVDEIFFESKKPTQLSSNLPQKFCLYVGDATWNKNLVNLAKAIKLANITCLFVGKIWERAKEKGFEKGLSHPELLPLKEFLRLAKDDKRFVFLGYVNDSILKTLYQTARANILVSFDEGFGYSPLEAGACSTPSVVSDIPVFRETLGNAALFVNPNDPYEIANNIGELYFKDELRENLGKKAKKRANEFTLKKFQKNLLEFLRAL